MIVLHPDATMEERALATDLESLQAVVGGYIEFLRFQDGSMMVVNEEGRLHGLPLNAVASFIAASKGRCVSLRGSVAFFTAAEADEMDREDS